MSNCPCYILGPDGICKACGAEWKPSLIVVDFKVENVYSTQTITCYYTEAVNEPEPGTEDDLLDWAEDELFQFTGAGIPEGDAAYYLEITGCTARPELVGKAFTWGV